MKTSTIAVIALVAVLYFTMNQRPAATVPALPPPQQTANNQGNTFGEIMAAIAAVGGAVKAGLDSSSQRA